MSKITITVEGSNEEIKPLIQFLARQEEQTVQPETQISVQPEEPTELEWTENQIRIIWRDISWDCKKILKKIYEKEEGVNWDSLLEELNLKANQVGGRLSSLGHQIRIHKYSKLPHPLIWNSHINGYQLDNNWRQAIAKVEGEKEEFQKELEK